MNVKRLSNSSEFITYNELTKALGDAGYLTFVKVPIKEVIDKSKTSRLRRSDIAMYQDSHFDFVITDTGLMPEFAVEFDGPYHFTDSDRRRRDIRKNRICALAQFPLLRVSDVELEKFDTISIMQFIAYRFVKWKEEYQRIYDELQSDYEEMTPEEKNRMTEDGFLDPSLDPSFRFDLEFPFPPTEQIRSELVTMYKFGLWGPPAQDKDGIWFTVMDSKQGPLDNSFFTECSYGIYGGGASLGQTEWRGGKLQTPGVRVLLEGRVRFVMRWALVIEEDYDEAESPANYFARTGRFPIYFADLPGAHIPSICSAISEYAAYIKVREWAEKNITLE